MYAYYLAYLFAIASLLYRLKPGKRFVPPYRFVALGVLLLALFAYEGAAQYALLISGYIVFGAMAHAELGRQRMLFIILSLAYLMLAIPYLDVILIAQAMLFAMLAEAGQFKGSYNVPGREKKEIMRDAVQALLGMCTVLIFLYMSLPIAKDLILLFVLAGYTLGAYASERNDSAIAHKLYSMERSYTKLGHGAFWVATGMLIAVSFLNSQMPIVSVAAALLIGDSAATITGKIIAGPRLPYNRRKTLSGSMALFAVTALISYPILGPVGLLAAALAAIVESLPLPLDDNLAVPLALTIFYVVF